ncbi:MAG: dephospho-CoA kinase, partial [Myxococcota bacterium]
MSPHEQTDRLASGVRLVGLTGGMASGKSTVHHMLVELGATVLDADAIYHALIAPISGEASELARRIAREFPDVLRDDGSLDRGRLGARVFADAAARERLGLITHPAVAAEAAARLARLAADGARCVVYDVPLLYERGLECGMDG